MEVLELEKQKLQNQCLCLEAEVRENEEKLNLLEKEFRKQDAVKVQNIEELIAVASHWAEKWQKVALTLQSTQEELEELKKNNSGNEVRISLYHSLKHPLQTCINNHLCLIFLFTKKFYFIKGF